MAKERRTEGGTGPSGRVIAAGLAMSLALGVVTGWIRWWEGFFVLFQGAGCGLLLAWLIGRIGRQEGKKPRHPGFRPALVLALLWWAAFMAGQGVGLGLAQPWFDPLGWLARVWDGKSTEFAFGVAATASIHRSFAMGASNGFWLILNLIDWFIMIFFLLAMPWSSESGRRKRKVSAGEAAS